MRFRAELSLDGLAVLNTEILPTLDKFGKACQLVLKPTEVYFVQEPVHTDGAQVVWRLSVDALFEPNSYKLNSRNNNVIAFAFDIALLRNVVKSAGGENVDSVEMKLASRMVNIGAGASQPHPFLTFLVKGPNLNLTHQLPISSPFTPAEVTRILQQADSTSLCDCYLDIQPLILRVMNLAEKLKNIGDSLTLGILNSGDLHLQVSGMGIFVGAEFRKLMVVPPERAQAGDPSECRMSPEQRLNDAIEKGQAQSVDLSHKQFAKSITASQVSHPNQLLCGIGGNGGYLHFMFGFENPLSNAALDDCKTLSFTLPTLGTAEDV